MGLTSGGGSDAPTIADPDDISELDFRVYNLMEVGDSIHDCTFKQRGLVMESLSPSLPLIPRKGGKRAMGINDFEWDSFYSIMTGHATFDFGDDKPVRNPLFGRDFMTTDAFD
jgi:hypothetical protein